MNTIKCSRLSTKNPACPVSYVRFLNAYPCETSVDIYINCELLVKNLAYQQVTDYYTVQPCVYHIEIYPSGFGKGKHSDCPIADICLNICPRSTMTIAVVGGYSGVLGIQEIFDTCSRRRDPCKAYVRFVNLSPNSPPLDVAFAGGTRLFRNVPYTTHTRYVPIDPGTYVLQLSPSGTGLQGLAMQPATFERGTFSTVYAVGNVGGTPPLATVVTVDGNY